MQQNNLHHSTSNCTPRCPTAYRGKPIRIVMWRVTSSYVCYLILHWKWLKLGVYASVTSSEYRLIFLPTYSPSDRLSIGCSRTLLSNEPTHNTHKSMSSGRADVVSCLVDVELRGRTPLPAPPPSVNARSVVCRPNNANVLRLMDTS